MIEHQDEAASRRPNQSEQGCEEKYRIFLLVTCPLVTHNHSWNIHDGKYQAAKDYQEWCFKLKLLLHLGGVEARCELDIVTIRKGNCVYEKDQPSSQTRLEGDFLLFLAHVRVSDRVCSGEETVILVGAHVIEPPIEVKFLFLVRHYCNN